MLSRGSENFLLYITARIRTFLKPGTVRVRKNFIQIRTWGYVPSNNFIDVRIRECGSGRQNRYQISHDDARIREYGSGRRIRSKILLHDDARIRGVWIRALEPLKKILFHVDARIQGVRILASMKF